MNRSVSDFVAGWAAGCSQVVVGQPFDVIRIRLQVQNAHIRSEVDRPVYKGPIDCLRRTIRDEGPRALFKGMLSPLTGVAAVNAVLFLSYGAAQQYFENRKRSQSSSASAMSSSSGGADDLAFSLSFPELVACGAFAGFANCLVVCPVELVKIRMQTQFQSTRRDALSRTSSCRARYRGNVDCILSIVRQRGLRGLFVGMSATVYREVPAYAGYFGGYELGKKLFSSIEGVSEDKISDIGSFVSGSLGGLLCWLVSYPQDVIKTRLQTQSDAVVSPFRKRFFDGGFFDCGIRMIRLEGWRSLFQGFSPTLLRAIPANGVTFLVYETVLSSIHVAD